LTVARAQRVLRHRSVTISHRALPTAQYRVVGVDKIDLDPELRPHHGH
jgi:hypothetical protein